MLAQEPHLSVPSTHFFDSSDLRINGSALQAPLLPEEDPLHPLQVSDNSSKCRRRTRLACGLVMLTVLLAIAVVAIEVLQLTHTTASSRLVVSDLCGTKQIQYGLHLNLSNPSALTASFGPATLFFELDDGQVASTAIPRLNLNGHETRIIADGLHVQITDEPKLLNAVSGFGRTGEAPSFKITGKIPIAIHLGLFSISLERDASELLGGATSSSSGSGGGSGGGGSEEGGETGGDEHQRDDNSILGQLLSSSRILDTNVWQGEGEEPTDVLVAGSISLAFASHSTIEVHLPPLALALLRRATEEDETGSKGTSLVARTSLDALTIGGGDSGTTVAATILHGAVDTLRELARNIFYNNDNEILITGQGNPELHALTPPFLATSPLLPGVQPPFVSSTSNTESQAVCYLQYLLDQVTVPLNIPTGPAGEPLVQVDGVEFSQDEGTYAVFADVSVNTPLLQTVEVPELRFKTSFKNELLGDLVVPRLQLQSDVSRYMTSIRMELTPEAEQSRALLGFLTSIFLDDTVPLDIRPGDDSTITRLLASYAQRVSLSGFAFVRYWVKDVLSSISLLSSKVTDEQTILEVSFPLHNPLPDTAVMIHKFDVILRDPTQEDVDIVSMKIDQQVVPPGDHHILLKATLFMGPKFGNMFKKVFFGKDVPLLLDISADTDISGPFHIHNYALSVDGHNYFQEIVRNIKVVPTFQHFDAAKQECRLTVHGTADIYNPAHLPLSLANLEFGVGLHDDAGFKPLKPDEAIFAGVARMLHDDKRLSTTPSSLLSSASSPSPSQATHDAKATTQTPTALAAQAAQHTPMRQEIQPIKMEMETQNYEVCLRLVGCLIRNDVIVDLLDGQLSLFLQDQLYHVGFSADRVTAPL